VIFDRKVTELSSGPVVRRCIHDGVGEPLHYRAQTLRHAGGFVVMQWFIDHEKSHGWSVQTGNARGNNTKSELVLGSVGLFPPQTTPFACRRPSRMRFASTR